MKYETEIDNHAGSLSLEPTSSRTTGFVYQHNGGAESITGNYAAVQTGPQEYSILVASESKAAGSRAAENNSTNSYRVIVLPDGEVSVNGRVFPVAIFDPRGFRGRRNNAATGGPQKIAALMPGRVVRLLVEPGQLVEAGQGLIVVEAMKMQNEMKSPRSGRVVQIKTEPAATVTAGQVLMIIE